MENRMIDDLSFASSRKRANASNTMDKTPTRQSICQLQEDKRVQKLLEQIENRNSPVRKKDRPEPHNSPLNFHLKLRKHEQVKGSPKSRPKTPTKASGPNLISGSRQRVASAPSPKPSSRAPVAPKSPRTPRNQRPTTPKSKSAKSVRMLPESPKVQKTQQDLNSAFTDETPRPAKKTPLKRHQTPPTLAPTNAKLTVHSPIEPFDNSVKVAIRVRPLNEIESTEENQSSLFLSDSSSNTILVPRPRGPDRSFSYDSVFWTASSQAQIFSTIGEPMVDSLLKGFNITIFGYGQTGSGKTFTMMGDKSAEHQGIIPRFYSTLLTQLDQMKESNAIEAAHCEISYFEIYNEKIYDLLNPPPKPPKRKGRPEFQAGPLFSKPVPTKTSLFVREAPNKSVYVAGLTKKLVSSESDAEEYLRLGNEERATAATGMNEKSSRSHSIFQIYIRIKAKTETGAQRSINCTASLIDLAGSERTDRAKTTGVRLKEGAAINKSLLTLGIVISALAEKNNGNEKTYIPYRDSVLTYLLKDSLGGNSRTAMIASVSPAASSLEETLSTLNYAKTAKAIVNKATVNEEIEAATIRDLQREIELLKKNHTYSREYVMQEKQKYEEEIQRLKAQSEAEKMEWENELQSLRSKKVREDFTIGQCPHLVNISNDPSLTGFLLFLIPEGTVTVGSGDNCEIHISGNLIEQHHCVLTREQDDVSVIPKDGETYLNGHLVNETKKLEGGDRLVFGSTHFFCFRNSSAEKGTLDFNLAKNELLAQQKLALEGEYQSMLERNKLEADEQIALIREQLDEGNEVNDGEDSLEIILNSLKNRMDETMHEPTVMPQNHFETVQLVKEANKLVGEDRKMIFEVSGADIIKATMGSQTSFFGTEKLKGHLSKHLIEAEDDPDASLTSLILADAGTQWETPLNREDVAMNVGTSMNGTIGLNRSRRKQISRKVSFLAMRSGLEATLDPQEDEDDECDMKSAAGVYKSLMKFQSTPIGSSDDGITQCLTSIQEIYMHLDGSRVPDNTYLARKMFEMSSILQKSLLIGPWLFNQDFEPQYQEELKVKYHKLQKNEEILMRFIVRILDEEDEFQDHARAKCLDLTKNLGTIIRAGPWDHTSILENIKSKKLKKAFSQGFRVIADDGQPTSWKSSVATEEVSTEFVEESTEQDQIVKDSSSIGFQSIVDSISDLSSQPFQSLASSLPEKNEVEQSLLKESALNKLVSDRIDKLMDGTTTTMATHYEPTS
ncbi:Oidioi.mRNA.OKI2018_I69.chr2.g7065.t1.cds [Oikopleura dioica]|uniref:Oidioi.mRNA.OKI2018_I69.chr2.g7065.t1.cds n=1 Tax=Oikopleura dioica TaxID=34765 RepID=A0ABN7T9S8_OIKDI|nr:Oidioi.mRNA.OKI2018_I69.chr2.g7065.t1.cds [Oikopleura dioica]